MFQAATKSRTNFSSQPSVAWTSASARSWQCAPNTRSAAVAVHLVLPGVRSRPSYTFWSEAEVSTRSHVEQVHGEVVGQRAGPVGENSVLRVPVVRVQRAHAADENRHLGRGQPKEVGPVQQTGLRRERIVRSEIVAEAVADRFETFERVDVGLLLRGVGATGRKRDRNFVSGLSGRFLDGGAPAQEIRSASETFLPLPPDCEPLKSFWIRSRACTTFATRAGTFTSQSFAALAGSARRWHRHACRCRGSSPRMPTQRKPGPGWTDQSRGPCA